MAWTIEFTDSARRQLGKLDKNAAKRILDYMDERVAPLEDPRSLGNALRGPLGDLWRYRVGDFPIICELRDAKLCVIVVRVGSRKDAYR